MDWRVDHRSHLPLPAQVERLLRELCAQPEQRAGTLLPDEVGIAKRLGVSRNTVRAAIERLVQEGLLERRRGVGTRVLSARAAAHPAPWERFIAELEPLGDGVGVSSATGVQASVDAAAAAALQIDAGATVLRLERVLADGDGPLAVVRSWFHPRLAFPAGYDFARPLWPGIERELGVVPVVAHEEVSAVVADAE